jgi:polysaccharide export outer membrane protein
MKIHSRSVALLWLALVLAVSAPCLAQRPGAAQATDKPGVNELPAASDRSGTPDYVIGSDDVLEIAVWNNTAITRTVPVRPDGKISLPLLNDVEAAGRTPMQLQASLTRALAAYIEVPEVSVIVREVHSFKVSVIGQVKTPGRYELTRRVTVLDVLAMSGGFTEFADRGGIVVLRREGATTHQIHFAYDKLTSGTGPNGGQETFLVQRDDIILVR